MVARGGAAPELTKQPTCPSPTTHPTTNPQSPQSQKSPSSPVQTDALDNQYIRANIETVNTDIAAPTGAETPQTRKTIGIKRQRMKAKIQKIGGGNAANRSRSLWRRPASERESDERSEGSVMKREWAKSRSRRRCTHAPQYRPGRRAIGVQGSGSNA